MTTPASPFASPGVRRALAALLLLFVAAVVIGFVWLPHGKPDFTQGGLWDAICRAAGVPRAWSTPQRLADPLASRVEMVPALLSGAGGDIGHGGTLARACTMCHGARGVSTSDVPNLAGQYSEVVYKQLTDFRHGQRQHALMQALAAGLGEQDIRDLAAFYAQLPRPAAAGGAAGAGIPALVRVGDPMRNIAPCASCHGGIDHKAGSPWLHGMSHVYLAAQLRQFATGARRNDPLGVMRNVARQLTPGEVDALARYYADQAEIGNPAAANPPAR